MSNTGSAGGAEPQRNRESFNTVAGLYDRYRSGYPRDIVDQMMEDAGIGPGSRVLEIGPGTGQLTVPLLERGAAVTAVELGEALAAVARRKISRFHHGEMVVSSFEDWALPHQPFDAVIAATSFHWLDPAIRANKCAQALRSGGTLLAVYPHHVQGADSSFSRETQTYYLKWGLSTDPDWRTPEEDEVPAVYPDIDQCDDFARVERRRIRRTMRYTTEEYAGLLSTDSLVLTLTPKAREEFLAAIRSLVDSRYDGQVSRDYLYEIVAARKRGERQSL